MAAPNVPTRRRGKYTCVCCGYRTLDEPPGSYAICAVCFWEDDLVQLLDPWFAGGANEPSLQESQRNFADFGASAKRFIGHVRRPTQNESRDRDWRPVAESDRQHVTTPVAREAEPISERQDLYYWKR